MSVVSRQRGIGSRELKCAPFPSVVHGHHDCSSTTDLRSGQAKLAVVQSSVGRRVGRRSYSDPNSIELLGVRIDDVTMSTALGRILDAANGTDLSSFAFVDADCLNISRCNQAYKDVLGEQQGVFTDGSGIALVSRLRGINISENVNGTDMFPLLCQAAAAHGISIFLLGAEPGVAGRVAANMSAEYPDLTIAGTHHGFFDASEEESVISMINQSGADILLVAMGAPRQELWIAAHRERLAPKVAIGVGGLFDFFSGRVWRAPAAMRRTGMEWVWRPMQEPGRLWRRYILGNPMFLARGYEQVASIVQSQPLAARDVAGITSSTAGVRALAE